MNVTQKQISTLKKAAKSDDPEIRKLLNDIILLMKQEDDIMRQKGNA